MNRFRTSSFALCAFLTALSSNAALAQGDSGFLRGKGKLDVAVTYSLDTYDEFWIGDDKIEEPPFGRVKRQTLNAYAAYGLTDDIDLAVSASYVHASTDEIFDDEHDFQDIVIQLKWRLASIEMGPGHLNLLAAPAVKFPLTHYEDDAVPAIGDGQVDFRARGIIQYLFNNGVFIALESGYDFRFDDPDDEFPIHISGGFTLWKRLTLIGFYSNVNSLGGFDIGEGPFPGVEEDYERVGAGMYLRISDHFGVAGNVWTTIDGENTGDVDGFSVGAVFRF